ncbi:MAG TPA: HD domain-containing phosphohydrolase [Polyangiaceae bacterium]|jgi:response regulator RpfG family c-di-GMP phosphodiesterase
MIESFPPEATSPCVGQVLLVDDESMVVRALGPLISKLGYQTICATETSQALTLLSLRRFDAIVTDLSLPMASGGVFATHVAALVPGVPLIVITGLTDLHEVAELLGDTKVDAIIPKPARNGSIARALARSVTTGKTAVEAREARLVADGLVRALALRDVETEGHSRRVAAWTLMLVQRTGIPKEEWLRAELGGLLHDVGKIGISDAILRKPSKLSEEEWVEMRRHPELGCIILSGIPALAGACDIVRSHHERWDGGGYPGGLAGEAIPLHARIFALIDTYDAMTSDRPYRKGMSHDAAVSAIRAGSGVQFDPRAVETFLGVPEAEWRAVARIFADHVVAAGAKN